MSPDPWPGNDVTGSVNYDEHVMSCGVWRAAGAL